MCARRYQTNHYGVHLKYLHTKCELHHKLGLEKDNEREFAFQSAADNTSQT